MRKIVLNSNEIINDVTRDFIIYNVIFSKSNYMFTIDELKQVLDGIGCKIESEYLYSKVISFTEKGLISQTNTGYIV